MKNPVVGYTLFETTKGICISCAKGYGIPGPDEGGELVLNPPIHLNDPNRPVKCDDCGALLVDE